MGHNFLIYSIQWVELVQNPELSLFCSSRIVMLIFYLLVMSWNKVSVK